MTSVKLRDDLVIKKTEKDGVVVFSVSDPVSGDEFEFGQEEHYLITQIADGVALENIPEHFRERFGMTLRVKQVEAFVQRLRLWGLIEHIDAAKPGIEDREEHTPLSRDDRYEMDPEDSEFIEEPGFDGGFPQGQANHAKPRWQPDRAGVLQRPVYYKVLWHEPAWIYFLGRIFRFVKYLVPLIAVAMVIALITIFNHPLLVEQDFVRFWKPWTLIQHLVFGFITVNLASKIVAGATCAASGGSVPSFGIHLALGIVPRFHVELGGWGNMGKRQILWTLASPILTKLALFSLSVLLWYVTRDVDNQLPVLAFMVAAVSLISLLMSANPMGTGDGYAVMSAILEQTNLRGKSLRALFSPLLPRRMKIDMESSRLGALRIYGILTIAYILTLIGLIIYFSAIWLESNFQGTGVLIFLLLLLAMITQVFQRIRMRSAERSGRQESRSVAYHQQLSRSSGPAGTRRRQQARTRADFESAPHKSRRFPWVRVILITLLIISFFVPYDYETGGVVELSASDRREVYSESPGIVEEVLIDGGQWVTAGTVIARMSSYREVAQVESTSASIKREQAELEKLLTTPRKEEVTLAEQQYEAARIRERFARSQLVRAQQLYKEGNVSTEDYEEKKRLLDVAVVDKAEASTNLELVKEGPHPEEIEAARAEIMRLEADLKGYQERLKRTQLVATIDGRLESLNLNELTGKYLDNGDLYTAVINDRFLRAEIEIPEADVPMVVIGDGARLKLWAYPDRYFRGQVVDIEPVVEQEAFGRVARVFVEIPNENGLLKPGITGYGKIMGVHETLALAFTHRLVRFFRVEMWSWIP